MSDEGFFLPDYRFYIPPAVEMTNSSDGPEDMTSKAICDERGGLSFGKVRSKGPAFIDGVIKADLSLIDRICLDSGVAGMRVERRLSHDMFHRWTASSIPRFPGFYPEMDRYVRIFIDRWDEDRPDWLKSFYPGRLLPNVRELEIFPDRARPMRDGRYRLPVREVDPDTKAFLLELRFDDGHVRQVLPCDCLLDNGRCFYVCDRLFASCRYMEPAKSLPSSSSSCSCVDDFLRACSSVRRAVAENAGSGDGKINPELSLLSFIPTVSDLRLLIQSIPLAKVFRITVEDVRCVLGKLPPQYGSWGGKDGETVSHVVELKMALSDSLEWSSEVGAEALRYIARVVDSTLPFWMVACEVR